MYDFSFYLENGCANKGPIKLVDWKPQPASASTTSNSANANTNTQPRFKQEGGDKSLRNIDKAMDKDVDSIIAAARRAGFAEDFASDSARENGQPTNLAQNSVSNELTDVSRVWNTEETMQSVFGPGLPTLSAQQVEDITKTEYPNADPVREIEKATVHEVFRADLLSLRERIAQRGKNRDWLKKDAEKLRFSTRDWMRDDANRGWQKVWHKYRDAAEAEQEEKEQ